MPLSARESLIVLNLLPGLGSVRINRLLEYFGSADLVLQAPNSMLCATPGIGERIASVIRDWHNCVNLDAELNLAARHGVRLVTIFDDEYPPVLRRMGDPPITLYVRGCDLSTQDGKRAISIVGSRACSPYGMTVARRFARELADAGCTIISGLARGIDTMAHVGALDASGCTIGVLGSGMAQFFPEENAQLSEDMIARGGAVVSEFPMLMRPSKTSFPQRNRIVAAWSRATLVVEAPPRSGSLHTAGLSSSYGNIVFAIPNSIDSRASAGCHELIRDGGVLCTSSHEILSDMGWVEPIKALATQQELNFGNENPKPTIKLSAEQQALCDAIAAGQLTLDALCCSLGKPAHELTPLLMRMQIDRIICPLDGARYALVKTK